VRWISFLLLPSGAAWGAVEPPFLSLHFKASKAVILSGDVRLEVTTQPAEEALADLRECRDGSARLPAGDDVVVIDATTRATLHLSQVITWIDPGDQGVLQTLAARRGRRWRLIRATEDGHHQWTHRPKDKKQSKRPIDDWTKRSEKHVTWEADEGRPRTASFALLYQAAALRLDRPGASAVLQVHAKGRLLNVALQARELAEVEVDLQRKQGGEERRVKGVQRLRRVTVDGDAAGDDGSESPVGLLGMSEGMELYLEPGSGLPVEVRGKVPKLGDLRVRLVEAELP
jgi:hypothetical protein